MGKWKLFAAYFSTYFLFFIISPIAYNEETVQSVNFQGRLTDNKGVPINANLTFTFRIYDTEVGGVKLWEEKHDVVAVKDGAFNIELGEMNPLPIELFARYNKLYLEVEVQDHILTPRQALLSVPYAFYSAKSSTATYLIGGYFNVIYDSTINGKLGIGVLSPQAKLDVYDDGSATKTLFKVGGATMVVLAEGNVGIGTTSPQAKLDIHSGGLLVPRNASDPAGANGMIHYNTSTNKFRAYQNGAWTDLIGSSGGGGLPSGSAGNTLVCETGTTWVATNTIVMQYDSGNVGIGTTSPSYKLHIQGGALKVENAASQDAVILSGRAGGTAGYSVTITPTTLTGNRTLTLADGDTVLVPGTMVPTTRTISTTSPLSGGGDLSANRTLSIAGLSSVGTANYIVGVNSGGTGWEYKQILGASNEIDITHTAGSVTIGIVDPLIVSKGGTGLSSVASGALLYGSGGNALNTLSIGASGTILSSNGSAPQWSTLSSLNIPTGSGSTNYIAKWSGTNSLTYTSAIYESGGNVGIGTMSPQAKLDIHSGGLLVPRNASDPAGANGMIHYNTSTNKFRAYQNGAWTDLIGGGGGGGLPSGSAGQTLVCYSGTIWVATNTIVMNSGRVGIGTTSPVAGFIADVNGGLRVSGNINFSPDGSVFSNRANFHMRKGNPQVVPLDTMILFERGDTTNTTGTREVLSIIHEDNASQAFPWTIYAQLTTHHTAGGGDATILNTRLLKYGTGWSAGLHSEVFNYNSGVALGCNIEMANGVDPANTTVAGLHILAREATYANPNPKQSNYGILIQDESTTCAFRTGIGIRGKGNVGIDFENSSYNIGIDMRSNKIKCGRIDTDVAGKTTRLFDGDNQIWFNWTGSQLQIGVDATVVKTFVIQHPLYENKYLVHATLEGPENAVYYRGTGQLKNGYAEITLPDYFESLTYEENRTIQLTPIDGFDQVCVKTVNGKQIVNGKFIVISSNPNSTQKFNWEVKAVRKDVEPLTTEVEKDKVIVEGFGPYKYLRKVIK